MGKTLQMLEIQARMAPGCVSLVGFLGNDKRTLSEIIEEDRLISAKAGCDCRKIADKLERIREIGMSGIGDFVKIEPCFEVKVEISRGKIPCPFGEPGLHAKSVITLRNLRSSKEITFTDLSIHLIGSHGFYQGKGSPYRLEPHEIIEMLEDFA